MTEKAIYLLHERTTDAALISDLQLRELGFSSEFNYAILSDNGGTDRYILTMSSKVIAESGGNIDINNPTLTVATTPKVGINGDMLIENTGTGPVLYLYNSTPSDVSGSRQTIINMGGVSTGPVTSYLTQIISDWTGSEGRLQFVMGGFVPVTLNQEAVGINPDLTLQNDIIMQGGKSITMNNIILDELSDVLTMSIPCSTGRFNVVVEGIDRNILSVNGLTNGVEISNNTDGGGLVVYGDLTMESGDINFPGTTINESGGLYFFTTIASGGSYNIQNSLAASMLSIDEATKLVTIVNMDDIVMGAVKTITIGDAVISGGGDLTITLPCTGNFDIPGAFKVDIDAGTTISNSTDLGGAVIYGDVGICVPSPEERLDVANCGFEPSIQISEYNSNKLSHSRFNFRKSKTVTPFALAETIDAENYGAIRWSGVNSSSAWAYAGGINMVQEGSAGATYLASAIVFKTGTDSSAPVEVLRIDKDGNVGIGTIAPSTLLELSQEQNPYLRFNNADTEVLSGDILGTLGWYSNDASAQGTGINAEIKAYAALSFTGGTRSANIGFFTTQSSTTTENMTLYANGDLSVVGRITGAGTFAEIHVHDASTAQSINNGATYIKSTAFTDNGPSSNATPDASNDKITITETGYYRVEGIVCASAGTGNLEWFGSVFLDGTEQDNIHWHRKISTAGDVGAMPFSGFIDVTTAPLDLDFRVRHSGGSAADFTITYANLNVSYEGET